MFSIVVAVSNNNGIGYKGTIPWKNKEDMIFFRNLTSKTQVINKKNAIIMGRITYESIGENPLKNRDNFIISRKKYENVESFINLDECLNNLINKDEYENIFVIGGQTLYNEAIQHRLCKRIFLNRINTDETCDVFFNYDESIFKNINEEKISDIVTSYTLEK
jgi:dihydrofolate reductase